MNTPTSPQTYVLYHANCPDGFGAAWAAWLKLGDAATYLPCAYGRPLPDIDSGSAVYIVDFSFPRADLEALRSRVQFLLVIDHHKTAKDALADLPFVIFDMTKSGAVLTWEYFHQCPAPELLLFVQDRDLWQWHLEDSKKINLGLWRATERSFDAWASLYHNWKHGSKFALSLAGNCITHSDQQMIDLLCKHPQTLRVGVWSVPCVNSPVLQSELGHELLQRNPHAPFAAVWCENEKGERVFSLRARPHDFDVSLLAKQFGGGGHQAAAGFKIDAPTLDLALPATA